MSVATYGNFFYLLKLFETIFLWLKIAVKKIIFKKRWSSLTLVIRNGFGIFLIVKILVCFILNLSLIGEG